ncbi:MAG: hypothetical protein WD176_07220 [Pirellulales bacterium]
MGRPYWFPQPSAVENLPGVEGVPMIGLHDLLFLKLLAGRMKDLADIMELLKRHLDVVNPEAVVARLQPEDNDLRDKFLDILRQAPVELANERRLGQHRTND